MSRPQKRRWIQLEEAGKVVSASGHVPRTTWRTCVSSLLPAGCTDPCPSCTCALSPVQEDHQDLGRWAASRWTVVLLQTNIKITSIKLLLYYNHSHQGKISRSTIILIATRKPSLKVVPTAMAKWTNQTHKNTCHCYLFSFKFSRTFLFLAS